MEPAVDPFHPLLRLLDRYRREVHHLRGPAGEGRPAETEQRLGTSIPASFQAFSTRWDGAVLFRGALRIRSLDELAPVRAGSSRVVLFADGPREGDHWGFAPLGEDHVFGRWLEGRLVPLFGRFDRWLTGMIQILESDPRREEAWLDQMLHADPESPYLRFQRAQVFLAEGRAEEALPELRRAVAADPEFLPAWHRLGDVLAAEDPPEARWAWLKALRAIRLPAPFPGFWDADPDLVSSLERSFPAGDDAWERELLHLLRDRVANVATRAEARLVEQAALAYARVFLDRGERDQARKALSDVVERSSTFDCVTRMVELRLLLVRIETDLGHHDHAERHLRPLLDAAEDPIRGRAHLALGRIVVARQEPWAEEILEDALLLLEGEADRARAWLLLAERHLLHDRDGAARTALHHAESLVEPGGDLRLRCRAKLLRGDLHRLGDGDLEAAERAYARAEELAVEMDDRELRLRMAVRAGDLAQLRGDAAAAEKAFRQACEGFRRLALPLREAWSRLRLGRLGDDESLETARARFLEVDLAAGVAAADQVEGAPARSLDWHLERATEHARLRGEAQRGRPPHTRADADRPERRLGAHQRSLAACSQQVVRTLGRILDDAVRELESASCRLGDPRLARYTAAVDLLAHHRSYEAARLLLDQLFTGYLTGPPGHALQGAITRSPNMAMVDGLLQCLEGEEDPTVLARAAEVLGWRRETEAAPRLTHLVSHSANLRVRRNAVLALGRMPYPPAISAIMTAMEEPDLAGVSALALLLLGERQAVDYHAQLLARGEKCERSSTGESSAGESSAGEVVGRFGDPSYLLLLIGAADRGGDAALGALQGLGYLGHTRAVPHLIQHTGTTTGRKGKVAAGALEILTGHHEPVEEPNLRARWERWWDRHQDAFPQGVRTRHGRVLDAGVLVERLAEDDLAVRIATYDELVITTGAYLPFDADGAWRVQVHHRERWMRWWRDHEESFPAGRWVFHGEITS